MGARGGFEKFNPLKPRQAISDRVSFLIEQLATRHLSKVNDLIHLAVGSSRSSFWNCQIAAAVWPAIGCVANFADVRVPSPSFGGGMNDESERVASDFFSCPSRLSFGHRHCETTTVLTKCYTAHQMSTDWCEALWLTQIWWRVPASAAQLRNSKRLRSACHTRTTPDCRCTTPRLAITHGPDPIPSTPSVRL